MFLRNKDYFKKIFLIAILSILIVLTSGNGLILMGLSSKYLMLVYCILGGILLLLFVLNVDVGKLLARIKQKKFSPPKTFTILFGILFLGILLSLIVNSNKSANFFNYLDMLFILIASFLFVNVFSFEKFCKTFVRILFVISICSLLIYLVVVLTKFDFSTSNFISSNRAYSNYSGLLLVLNDRIHGIGGSSRFMSLFWEPGVFGTFLIVALIIEALYIKKTNWLLMAFFVFCIVLTLSTASIILLYPVCILFVSQKLKGKIRIVLIVLLVAFLLIGLLFFGQISSLLGKLFPAVFSKITESNYSFTTRIYSPFYYLKVFSMNVKSVLFGWGGVTANQQYISIVDSSLIDARTSTSGFYMAAVGITGLLFTLCPLVGIICDKKISFVSRIVLCFIFICLFNKENHFNILGLNIFYFYYFMNIPSLKERTLPEGSYKSFKLQDKLFGQNNTGKFSKNIFGSFAAKGISLIVGLATLPIYSSFFLSGTNYSVWLNILSIISILLYMDFGFGNGMKNKLIDAFAKKDVESAKKYISATYVCTAIISSFVFSICLILILSIDVNNYIGDSLHIIDSKSLKICLVLISLSVCVEFVMRNVTFVLQARGNVAIGNSFPLISNVMLLLSLFIFKSFPSDRFIFIGILYFLCINVPLLIASIIVFKKEKELLPSLKVFSFEKSREIFGLGIKYFIVQICFLVLWTFNTILITNFLDPSSSLGLVDSYTKYYKVYSMIVTLTSVVSSTVWVNATDAFVKKDKERLKKLYKVSFWYGVFLIFVTIIASLFLQLLFDTVFVTSYVVSISVSTILVFASYAIIFVVAETLITYSNAFAHLNSQVILSILFASAKIPLFILYVRISGNLANWTFLVLYNCIYGLSLSVFIPIELRIAIKKQFSGGVINR